MTRRANVDAWLQLFKKRKFDPGLAEQWARHARPNIRLIPKDTLDEDGLPPGRSKLGGEPDLPVGMEWPTRPAYANPDNTPLPEIAAEDSPLHLIAQINLKDVAAAGCDLPLPDSGLLLFFYDAEVQPWGMYPEDAVGWRVIYVAGETATERHPSPFDLCLVQSIQLNPSEDLPVADWMEEQLQDEKFNDEFDKLQDDDFDRMWPDGHAFGGWPHSIQHPVEFDCELIRKRGEPENSGDGRTITVSDVRDSAAEWRLLLQIDSDDDMIWSWGGGGRIYFLCRESDIAARRFDRVWVVLQCM